MLTRLAVLLALCVACSKPPPGPGERELETASQRIASSTAGEQLARGNTDAARARAEKVAETLSKLDRELFAGQDEDKAFTRTEAFMVHCQHGAEGVAFLIHVPQFKRYKDDVRKTLLDAAWAAAGAATQDLGDGLKLGIGLRGSLMYGATAVGLRDGAPTIELGTAVDLAPLYPFFIGPPPAQAEAAAKPDTAAPDTPPAPPEPPPPPPRLQVTTTYMELLAASIVDTQIRAHDADLQRCAAGLTPGAIHDYRISLAGDGTVKKLVGKGSPEPPEALTTCLNEIAKAWKFPKKQLKLTRPEGGSLRFGYQSAPLD